MAPSAQEVLAAVKACGVPYTLTAGWDDPAHEAGGSWYPNYVIEHHTANGGAAGNNPSLDWCVAGVYPPVRNCHFLVGRDGHIFVVYGLKCYHAGAGGPGSWGDGPYIPQDEMNGYAYGIEIESKGTSLDLTGGNGLTAAQQDSAARLTAALLDMLGRSTSCAINHRTWAPHRKTDTLLEDSDWHRMIAPYRGNKPIPPIPPLPPIPPTTEEIDMLLIRRAGTPSVYFLSGNQLTRLVSGDDYRALLQVGVKEVNLTAESFDLLNAGKD